MAQKVCSKCGGPGPFVARKGTCNQCRSLANKAWYKANPHKHHEYLKRKIAKNPRFTEAVSNYRKAKRKAGGAAHELEKRRNRKQALARRGLSLADHAAMRSAHDDRCAICRQPETCTRNGHRKLLAVDHDHATGAVRGLLCHFCNTGLGCFRDDPAHLAAAIKYLQGQQRFYAGASTK